MIRSLEALGITNIFLRAWAWQTSNFFLLSTLFFSPPSLFPLSIIWKVNYFILWNKIFQHWVNNIKLKKSKQSLELKVATPDQLDLLWSATHPIRLQQNCQNSSIQWHVYLHVPVQKYKNLVFFPWCDRRLSDWSYIHSM